MRRMQPLPYLDAAKAGLSAFGLSDFRPGQAEVVSAVMSGRNAVVVMPTGAGKSLCYQLPASLLPGVTLVISPLIALMKDQVEQLTERGIPAAFLNSTLTDSERLSVMRRLRQRELKLLYVAPERFRSAAFLEALTEVGVELLAVDEAHCISQWGHDFRPDYAWLGKVRKRLRPPRTVALTATAPPEVRDDIVRCLLMKDPQVFVAGFDRPNLFLEVTQVSGDDHKRQACLQLVSEGGSGVIYCSTRKNAEALHKALKDAGHQPVLYHAGMEDEDRRNAQDAFMGNENAVAVATNAFGMGIDKPDIRFVVHANIPRAVEAYYQEIGRAGRDGKPARAVLLFNHADVYTQERLIQSNHPPDAVFQDVWKLLSEVEEFDHPLAMLAAQVGSSEFEVSAAVRLLEREGKVSRGSRGEGSYELLLEDKALKLHPVSQDARTLLSTLTSEYPVGKSVKTELPILARRAGLSFDQTKHALALLEKSHGLKLLRRPFSGRTIRVSERVSFDQLGLDLSRMRAQERQSLLLLKRMKEYAYARTCRRAFLLRYFGETDLPTRCGGCDLCEAPRLTLADGSSHASGTGSVGPAPHSELAMSELRRWRRELSNDLGVPPYIIFNDATLLGLATALPVDREQFLRIKGTGESRWERFGPKVVEICLMARAAGDQPAFVAAAHRKKRTRVG